MAAKKKQHGDGPSIVSGDSSFKVTSTEVVKRKKPKAPPAELVIEWLANGRSAQQIEAMLRKRYPNERAEILLNGAVNHFEQVALQRATPLLGWALSAYRVLYQKAIAIDDLQAALKSVELFTKLVITMETHGLNVPADDSGTD